MTVHILKFLLGSYLKWEPLARRLLSLAPTICIQMHMQFSQSLCIHWQSLIAGGAVTGGLAAMTKA